MIDRIAENLYISDAASVLYSPSQLRENKITHILTTSVSPIPEEKKLKDIQYKFVFIIDLVTQDILANNLLEEALNFLEEAIRNGGVALVHCEVGISRSVTIAAAYLMRKYKWNAAKAIEFIKNSRPIACPNSSFVRQLEIFYKLEYKADSCTITASPEYRNFCVNTGNMVQYMGESTSEDRPEPEMTPLADLRNSTNPTKKFRCQKCRQELFHDTHLMYHTRGKGTNLDEYDQTNSALHKNEELCMVEYLITPMKWMDLQGSFKGKITCPKCNLMLGKFIWGGRQCEGVDNQPCSAHISPWIYIQKRRVDMFSVPKSTPPPIVNVIEAETTETTTEMVTG